MKGGHDLIKNIKRKGENDITVNFLILDCHLHVKQPSLLPSNVFISKNLGIRKEKIAKNIP